MISIQRFMSTVSGELLSKSARKEGELSSPYRAGTCLKNTGGWPKNSLPAACRRPPSSLFFVSLQRLKRDSPAVRSHEKTLCSTTKIAGKVRVHLVGVARVAVSGIALFGTTPYFFTRLLNISLATVMSGSVVEGSKTAIQRLIRVSKMFSEPVGLLHLVPEQSVCLKAQGPDRLYFLMMRYLNIVVF